MGNHYFLIGIMRRAKTSFYRYYGFVTDIMDFCIKEVVLVSAVFNLLPTVLFCDIRVEAMFKMVVSSNQTDHYGLLDNYQEKEHIMVIKL